MVASGVCESCRGIDLAALGMEGRSEPDHCYGRADRPAPKGVLGGYRCSCDCRSWRPADRLWLNAVRVWDEACNEGTSRMPEATKPLTEQQAQAKYGGTTREAAHDG